MTRLGIGIITSCRLVRALHPAHSIVHVAGMLPDAPRRQCLPPHVSPQYILDPQAKGAL